MAGLRDPVKRTSGDSARESGSILTPYESVNFEVFIFLLPFIY